MSGRIHSGQNSRHAESIMRQYIYPNDYSFLVFQYSKFSNVIPLNSKLEEGWHLRLGGK